MSPSLVQSTEIGTKEPRKNVHSAGGKVRPVWDNPILWREIRTWAYGKKILLVRIAYWAVFLVCIAVLVTSGGESAANPSGQMPSSVQPSIALLVVSLVLLNAAAVTALTNERDAKALDLLLVTDLSPREIVFGKLGGAFYNAKEMVLFPLLLFAFLWYTNRLPTDSLIYLCVGWCVIAAFAAMLGLHSGITYANSRTAIATSLGTLMFLFLGVATCMRIMLAFSSSFEYQLTSFLGFIAGGSVGLFVALGWRNPSRRYSWRRSLPRSQRFTSSRATSLASTTAHSSSSARRTASPRPRCLCRPYQNSISPWGEHRSAKVSWVALAVIAERFDYGEHLFERDEAATVLQFVAVDSTGKLGRFGRELVVAIDELASFTGRVLTHRRGRAAIDKRFWGEFDHHRHEIVSWREGRVAGRQMTAHRPYLPTKT